MSSVCWCSDRRWPASAGPTFWAGRSPPRFIPIIAQALNPFAKAYAWLGGGGALLATYAALLVVLSAGVAALGADVRKFALAFTVVFVIAYASWIFGSYAYVAAVTPAEQQKFGLSWSLKLDQ